MATEKIKDFGDTVAGSKKSLWRLRGFLKEDITDMAEKEILATVVKKNIWKEPDYAGLYAEGCYREDLYYLKLCYVALGASISPTITDKIKDLAVEYSEFLVKFRDWIMPKVTEHKLDYNKDLITWLINNDYLIYERWHKTLTEKASRNAAFGNSFVSFINKNLRGIVNNLNNYNALRDAISKAHGDDESNIQARVELCRTDVSSNHYITKSFFVDCYASGFPINYVPAVKQVGVYPTKRNGTDFVYVVGSRTPAGVRIDYPCEEKEPIDRILRLIADGTYTDEYKKLVDLRKSVKNAMNADSADGTNGKTKSPIVVERTELPNAHVLRKGPRMRKGDAQISALLYDANNANSAVCFNFRGGEFGNWQNKRQECLNCAVDSFSDLAYVTDLPFSAMSVCFTGEQTDRLTIAWGSRGRGNAAAHYEPATTVINLTKYKGAGSLAHEWGHALDHAIGKWCLKGCKTQVSKDLEGEFATNLYKHHEMTKQAETVLKQVSELMNALKHKRVTLTDEQKAQYCKEILESVDKRIERYGKMNMSNLYGLIEEKKANAEEFLKNTWDKLVNGTITFEEYGKLIKEKGYKNYVQKVMKDAIMADIHTKQHPNELTAPETQVVATEFYKDANKLDENRAKAYYSKNVELFARAFESFVADELKVRNMVTQYLVHGTSGESYKKLLGMSPYPMGEERKEFNKLFRGLLDTVADVIVGGRFNPKFKELYQKVGFVETKYFDGEGVDKTEQKREELQMQAAVGKENIKREMGLAEAGRVTAFDANLVAESAENISTAEHELREMSEEVPEYNTMIHCVVSGFNEQTQVVSICGIGDSEKQHMPIKLLAQLISCKLVKIIEGTELLPTYVTSVVVPSLAHSG